MQTPSVAGSARRPWRLARTATAPRRAPSATNACANTKAGLAARDATDPVFATNATDGSRFAADGDEVAAVRANEGRRRGGQGPALWITRYFRYAAEERPVTGAAQCCVSSIASTSLASVDLPRFA